MRNYRIPIVGTRYRDEREQEFFSQLQSEPSLANLFFEPEPDNQFDPLAIKVCCATVGTPRIFTHLGSIPKNMTHILHRAFQRWGWRGVRGAVVREQEVHRLLTRQRVLGLSLIWGTRWNSTPQ